MLTDSVNMEHMKNANVSFEALGQKGRRAEPITFEAYFSKNMNDS